MFKLISYLCVLSLKFKLITLKIDFIVHSIVTNTFYFYPRHNSKNISKKLKTFFTLYIINNKLKILLIKQL